MSRRLSSRRAPQALIASVDPASPADRGGITAGECIASVEGRPIRDLIEWRWLACDDAVTLDVIGRDGRRRTVTLTRELGQDWGIEFRDVVFDGIRPCVNACSFCFIDGLPRDVRPSLQVRDDDYRLSFLTGTFVTLTNLSAADEHRIVEEGLSPLRVSLHAVDSDVRAQLMGPRHQRGLDALERLLAAGIEVHLQIVLVPDVNDGAVLAETLTWALRRPGILSVGVVPVGYTRHSSLQRGFDEPDAARAVIALIEDFEHRAIERGRGPWVYAADEFYGTAWGSDVIDHLPDAAFYGDFELFEDGIGIVRTTVDAYRTAIAEGRAEALVSAMGAASIAAPIPVIVGEAVGGWFDRLIARSPLEGRLRPLTVENRYFGGNVDVTGLLAGADIVEAIRRDRARTVLANETPYAICAVIFNDEGLTIDGWTAETIESATGARLAMVSLTADDWLSTLADAIAALG